MKKKKERKCVWRYQEIDDYYETSCKRQFCLVEGDCKENYYKFCPGCGREIKEVRE